MKITWGDVWFYGLLIASAVQAILINAVIAISGIHALTFKMAFSIFALLFFGEGYSILLFTTWVDEETAIPFHAIGLMLGNPDDYTYEKLSEFWKTTAFEI
jgi:hypothetical protein